MPDTPATYVVKTSSAHMPNSCWGTYRRVAVLEVEPGLAADDVRMISERARGVRRIVETWERRNVGKTDRCAYRVAVAEAEALVSQLHTPTGETR